MFRLLFSRHWWYATLLVMAAVAVMARLGLWQLDRLAERRAFNARVSAQMSAPTLNLNDGPAEEALTEMEYRSVSVTGEYDHAQQVALRNQAYNNRNGVHLLTPLLIAGSEQTVLVDRGWIPLEDAAPENWSKYDEPGVVQVRGVIRLSQAKADFGSITDPPGELKSWNLVNVARIDEQVSYSLLPVYVQQTPETVRPTSEVDEETGLISGIFPAQRDSTILSAAPVVSAASANVPIRVQPDVDLSEGPHLGYAIQWFAFAAVLAIGYPRYVWQNTRTEQGEERMARMRLRPDGVPSEVGRA